MPTRRDVLRSSLAFGAGLALFHPWRSLFSQAPAAVKNIAAIITEFRTNSHAEVLAGGWLEGFELDGMGERPQSKLVAMFTDQVAAKDLSRDLSKKHGVPIYPTIRETLG